MTEQRPILWSAAEVGRALGFPGEAGGWAARGVSIDSRSVEPGDLFIALSGPNHDGNDYVADALAKGAVAAIASRDDGLSPVLVVSDTMEALETLALTARDRSNARIAAVTGSVGKTGTKETLALALGKLGRVHKTTGNLNNHIGLPLTLCRMPADTEFGVFELGMNHAGELTDLSRMLRPDVSIITTVEAVHLEFFDGIEAICDAKCEIFKGMDAAGAAVINADHPLQARMVAAARSMGITRILDFGTKPDTSVRLIDHSLYAACSAVTAEVDGQIIDYCLGAPGIHWVMNSLSVLAAVKALGADPVATSAAFSEIRAPRGRGALIRVPLGGDAHISMVDESYNASPASVRAAISVLANAKPGPGGKRVLVLGDMLELGPEAEALHVSLRDDIEASDIDVVHCCGPNMTALHKALPEKVQGCSAMESADLAGAVAASLGAGDLITVKGSLGSRMAAVVSAIEALGE